MIDPTHSTPLTNYRHQELLRQAEQARLVRLAGPGRNRRRWQGLHFRLPAIVARLFAAAPSNGLAVEPAPAHKDTPTAA
jgi:hypothetical protein